MYSCVLVNLLAAHLALKFGNWTLISQCGVKVTTSLHLLTLQIFLQESSNLVVKKKEDKTRGRVSTRSVTKEKILISNSQISEQQNPPPLVTALKASAEQNVASFHFPGHNRGPILDAQQQAAKLFGSLETWFPCRRDNMWNSGSHYGYLFGLYPKYIIPDYNFDWDIAGGVLLHHRHVKTAIKELEKEGQKAAAVFMTSPTYHGICSNLSEITQLCHSHGISFLDVPSFPKFPAIDPLRLTIGFQQLGLSGYEADEILCKDHDIICELVDTQSITFVINLGTCREHVQKLVSGIKHLAATSAPTRAAERKVDSDNCAPFADIKTSLIPRVAFFNGKGN
ncbi:hypothetical protein M0R45_018834 [Rubus argutus]|uniref:Uncharacterized protein n=1 Tax=Rubus argutus TaxID=59490 RepID=A0AAW1X3P2_RUBAR